MSSRAAQLAIELTERGADDVAGGLDRVTSSARDMGNTVETAAKQADTATSKIEGTAGAADEMASKGSQAAGAMGGLGSLIGGSFGKAMESGGVALQAAADSGDLLNAALENSIVTSARAKAATIGKTVAEKASAAATRATTIAQKALNLAQRASPIGLIITGVILLVGLLVLAYKRSSTFRAVVQGALGAVQTAVGKVVGAFKALSPVIDFIKSVVKDDIAAMTLIVQTLRDKTVAAWGFIKDKAIDAFHAITAPVQAIIDLVQSLLDKISSIHLPHIDLPGPLRTGAGFGVGTTTATETVNISLTVNPAPGTTTTGAQQLGQAAMDAIDARLRLLGRKPVFS